VNHLHHEFEFVIVTRDRDLGEHTAYRDIEYNKWQRTGHALVRYLTPEQQSIGNLRRLINNTQHDLVYVNSFFEPLTVKVLLNKKLGWLCDKPIVVAPRGEFAWASLRLKYPKKAVFMRLARMIGLYDSVTWHASSAFEADDIVKVFNIHRQSIQVALDLPTIVENGAEDLAPAPERTADGIRVVFLSRISPEKNLDFALKILSRVRTKVGFDIIGPLENTAYWNECQKFLHELPTNVSARSLGSIKPSEVLKTLSQYDLLLFPSGGENYGHVIAESLTSGTQVLISTNTPWRNLEARGLGWDLPLDDINSFVRIVDEVGSASKEARLQRRKIVKANMRQVLCDSSAMQEHRRLFNAAILGIENRGGLGR